MGVNKASCAQDILRLCINGICPAWHPASAAALQRHGREVGKMLNLTFFLLRNVSCRLCRRVEGGGTEPRSAGCDMQLSAGG